MLQDTVMRLVHVSDPHLGPLPPVRPWQLVSKRLLGYLNWKLKRARRRDSTGLERLMTDAGAQSPDHIVVTGDLVNLALPAEYPAAAHWLSGIGPPDRVTAIPGNHDAYVPGGLARAVEAWSSYLWDQSQATPSSFPHVRVRDDVALIGVSTAIATAPFMATGRVGADQLTRLSAHLNALGARGLMRVILIHHPPQPNATSWHKRLIDARRFRDVIAQQGAELILHGHTHLATSTDIAGLKWRVPVIGVPSASQAPGDHQPAGRYNLLDIDRTGQGWSIRHRSRGYDRNDTDIVDFEDRRLEVNSLLTWSESG